MLPPHDLPLYCLGLWDVHRTALDAHGHGQVRGMAAAIVKSIARWMEGQLDEAGPCQALVQQVLTQLVQEANPGGSRYAGAQGPTIHENEAWDSIMPTHQSLMATEVTGQCGLNCLADCAADLVITSCKACKLLGCIWLLQASEQMW